MGQLQRRVQGALRATGVALGLGLDLRLGKSFDLRLSGGFGDMEGFAVTAAWVR